MKNELTADEAAELVDKSARHFRAKLREMKIAGTLNQDGAWQDPPKPNGTWKIRRVYLSAIAAEQGWTAREG